MAIVTKRRTFAVCVAMAATLLSSCSARRAPTADRCNPAEGAALTPARVSFAPPLPADPTASPSSALRSGLQLLLREQVDVLVYANAAHLAPHSDSKRARGAAAVLDENASALSFALSGCHVQTRNTLRSAWAKRADLLWQALAFVER